MLSKPKSPPSLGSSAVDVDVERQQIADGVAVLGAVQPVHDVACPGWPCPATRDRATRQPRRERRRSSASVGCGMPCGGIARTLSLRSTRSHVARVGRQVVQAGRFEVDRIVGRLRVPVVVAADAVLLDPGLLLRRASAGAVRGACGPARRPCRAAAGARSRDRARPAGAGARRAAERCRPARQQHRGADPERGPRSRSTFFIQAASSSAGRPAFFSSSSLTPAAAAAAAPGRSGRAPSARAPRRSLLRACCCLRAIRCRVVVVARRRRRLRLLGQQQRRQVVLVHGVELRAGGDQGA